MSTVSSNPTIQNDDRQPVGRIFIHYPLTAEPHVTGSRAMQECSCGFRCTYESFDDAIEQVKDRMAAHLERESGSSELDSLIRMSSAFFDLLDSKLVRLATQDKQHLVDIVRARAAVLKTARPR